MKRRCWKRPHERKCITQPCRVIRHWAGQNKRRVCALAERNDQKFIKMGDPSVSRRRQIQKCSSRPSSQRTRPTTPKQQQRSKSERPVHWGQSLWWIQTAVISAKGVDVFILFWPKQKRFLRCPCWWWWALRVITGWIADCRSLDRSPLGVIHHKSIFGGKMWEKNGRCFGCDSSTTRAFYAFPSSLSPVWFLGWAVFISLSGFVVEKEKERKKKYCFHELVCAAAPIFSFWRRDSIKIKIPKGFSPFRPAGRPGIQIAR